MDIIRNADGTLVVPVAPARHHEDEDHAANPSSDHGEAQESAQADAGPTTRVLHPGEGGYDEALSESLGSRRPSAWGQSDPKSKRSTPNTSFSTAMSSS